MKTIKGWIPTTVLAATLLFASITANAGIITAGYATKSTDVDPCSADQTSSTGIITAGLTGIITAGFTGIITAGFTGIIVTDFAVKDTTSKTTACGIITAG